MIKNELRNIFIFCKILLTFKTKLLKKKIDLRINFSIFDNQSENKNVQLSFLNNFPKKTDSLTKYRQELCIHLETYFKN